MTTLSSLLGSTFRGNTGATGATGPAGSGGGGNAGVTGSSYFYSGATGPVSIDNWDPTDYATADYVIQVTDTDNSVIQVSKVVIYQTENTTPSLHITDESSSLSNVVSFSTSIPTSNVELFVTALSTTNVVVDFVRLATLPSRWLGSLQGDLMTMSGTEDLQTGSGTVDLNT